MRKGGLKQRLALGRRLIACYAAAHEVEKREAFMDVDAVTNENQPGEVGRHARDYSRFVALFKWGAIISFIAAMVVLMIIA
ncbi:MAG TPA: hypothetical protein VD768_03725 [Sphingomicrobium sp.]|nr:hypothetical protein [Sphingomicrobium sp.]